MTWIELIQFHAAVNRSDVLVGEFSTSTQQLRLKTPLLRFPGETPTFTTSRSGFSVDACGAFGPAGPGPARDRTPVRVQRQHVSLLLYSIVSSAAALTIIITLTVLFLTVINRKHRYSFSTVLTFRLLPSQNFHSFSFV